MNDVNYYHVFIVVTLYPSFLLFPLPSSLLSSLLFSLHSSPKWQVSEHLLSIYLDEYPDTPWDALKYLVRGSFSYSICTHTLYTHSLIHCVCVCVTMMSLLTLVGATPNCLVFCCTDEQAGICWLPMLWGKVNVLLLPLCVNNSFSPL